MAQRITPITLLLWGSLALFPASALAQVNKTSACFRLNSTNEAKIIPSTLLNKEAALQALPAGSTASLFVGKSASTDPQLCYGPFDSLQSAAVFAVSWVDGQPLLSLNLRVSGFSFAAYTSTPDKKGEAKLGEAQSFSVSTAAFANSLREAFDRKEIHVGIIAPAKSYAFSAPDAFMPAFEEDTLTLTRDQNVLSLGQENFCEESTGCLFWERVLLGETPTLAYIPSGHVIFPEQAINAPDGSWKLYARARGTVSFIPNHQSSVNNPQATANSAPAVIVSLWALGVGKEGFDSLGYVEILGASPENIAINFTPEGVSLQSNEANAKPTALALDTKRYKTVDAAPLTTNDNITTNQSAETPIVKPAAKPATKSVKPSVKYYSVKNGDSLWSISNKFGVSVESLRKANKLSKKAILQPGQKLVVPGKR
jgi:LysM repeat protein